MRRRHWWISAIVVVISLIWAVNSSLLVTGLDQHQTRIIAHRGVHQVYAGSDRSPDACHASPIAPITHGFVENTIPSMQAAFRNGASIVGLDVHLTTDGVFAVFHDWTLKCRTDGTGVTHEQTFAVLRALDPAYNLDDGSGTYPLRGQAVGLMPSLTEVLEAELGGQYLINFKSNRATEGTALATLLQKED